MENKNDSSKSEENKSLLTPTTTTSPSHVATPKVALIAETLLKQHQKQASLKQAQANQAALPSIVIDGVKKPLTSESNIRLQSELVRKNWKNVLDVAKKNKDIFNDSTSYNNYHQNDMFMSEKFNWIFFSIIMSILVIFSIIICFCVYYFMPQFRI